MKMKSNKNSSYLSLLLLLLIVSCNDKFLDVPVQGGVTVNSDPDLATKLVTGVYHSLIQGSSFGGGDFGGGGVSGAFNFEKII